MTTIRVDSGESLQLVFNAFNGREDLFVRAFVYDENDILIATQNLSHRGNAFYRDSNLVMAGILRYVKYKVYSDAGYTTQLREFAEQQDQFLLRPGSDGIVRNDELTLVFEDNTDDEIEIVFEDEAFELDFSESDDDMVLEFNDDESFDLAYEDTTESIELVVHDC